MEQTRPYWKVAVSLLFSLAATILIVVVGIEMIFFLMPFVIGWLIACIANPLVNFLEKHLKIVRKWGSAITIIAVLAIVVGLVYLGVHALVVEIGNLITNFPEIYEELKVEFQEISNSLSGVIKLLPENVRTAGSTWIDKFNDVASEWIASMSVPAVEAAGDFAKGIPGVLIGTIVAIISSYFFIAERDEVITWFKKITPKPIKCRVAMIISNLKYAIGGYFKAQFKIMLVVGSILLLGFGLMRMNYAILLAILIAMLDFLPFFGTGTALIPWGVYEVMLGNYKTAVMLLALYGITQLVRQLIQPKLVGDGVGLKPLPTLVFIYIGYKVGSVLGMIFAVPIGLIVINMYHAGAFDYILDDAKILIKGIISLRE